MALAGTAESFLNASHLMKTRNAHQVSALALAILQERAFLQTGDSFSSQEQWKDNMKKTCPMFLHWNTVLNLELSGLIFVRAHRERKFSLYLDSLKTIAPWFYALDHYHYARWVPVHICDMEKLPTSIDQTHEQNNARVKGSGCVIGLLQNPITLRKWLLAGLEQAQLIKEFEAQLLESNDDDDHFHHDEGYSTQNNFRMKVVSLVEAFEDMGNPNLKTCQHWTWEL